MSVKSILVSQPKPTNGKSPYNDLSEKYNVTVDFRSFIHVEGLNVQEFRQQKVKIEEHTAVIFTSRKGVDFFFKMCEEMRVKVSDSMKYFCMSEAVALYLQNYVVYRKRKIFHGKTRFVDLIDTIKKHKDEKFLLPCSDILKPIIPELLEKENINYTKSILYRTVCSDLSDLEDVSYDILVFYSPAGIESLYKNFPDFIQNKTKIACFGETTKKAVEKAGLSVDIHAPNPKYRSMTMAIDSYLKAFN